MSGFDNDRAVGQQQEKTEQGGLDRSPAQFFFEVGYGACWAEAYAELGKAPFPLSDDLIERAWAIAGEAHDDPAEYDAYLARANGSATPNTPASNDFVLVPREPTEAMYEAGYDATRLEDGTPQFAKAGFCLGHSGKIYRAMLAAAPASPEPASNEAPGRGGVWQPIETAPRDGTKILGWNAEYGARETNMGRYGEGSIGYARWKSGDGPLNFGWDWIEPKANCGHTWKPTHWMPLPAAPAPGCAA